MLTDFQYHSKDGPLPFDADIEVKFTLEPADSGTKQTVNQRGFPDEAIADEFYHGCVQGWKDTMASFKKTIEGK